MYLATRFACALAGYFPSKIDVSEVIVENGRLDNNALELSLSPLIEYDMRDNLG